MVEDDKPPTILPKPNSEEPNSAGVTSTPLTFTKGGKYSTCRICFKEHGPLCSYFDYVPPGATVGPGYSVICHRCCHYISMPSWICNNCGGKISAGKVIIMHCIICKSNYQHESADCPHDEDKAAECRWIREVDSSKKYTPCVPKYVPRTPIPQELW